MDAGRVLVRYTLPGGVALLLGALTQIALHWSWGEPITRVLDVAGLSAVGLIFGTLTIGFITFQIYYSLYRPIVLIPAKLVPRRRSAEQTGRIRTRDRGGKILSYLDDLPGNVFERLEGAFNVEHSLADRARPKCDGVYARRWYERNAVVRSLIDDISMRGGAEIKHEYNELLDQYHSLGACRASVVIPQLLNLSYIGWHWGHPGTGSIAWWGAFALSAAATLILAYGFHRSREDVWHGLTSRTGRNLRAWLVLHPDFLPERPPTPQRRTACSNQQCKTCRPAAADTQTPTPTAAS